MRNERARALAASRAFAAIVLLVAFIAAAVGLAGLSGCAAADSQQEGGTLRVGVRSDIVNFGYLNERTGKYYGLEIDIAEEMARRMGYADVEFVTVTPDTRKDMLMNGEVDCLAACYSISDTRLENFDFSPAYYTDDAVIMVENSSRITDIVELAECTFGAMSGSNTAPQLVLKLTDLGFTSGTDDIMNLGDDNQFDTFRLVQMPSYEELSLALEEGRIDAACMDGAIAQTYMNEDRSLLDFSISEQEYGVATQKGSALSQPVADAIQAMLDDGTIAGMIDKWN